MVKDFVNFVFKKVIVKVNVIVFFLSLHSRNVQFWRFNTSDFRNDL